MAGSRSNIGCPVERSSLSMGSTIAFEKQASISTASPQAAVEYGSLV
jgi:hypothetical protein